MGKLNQIHLDDGSISETLIDSISQVLYKLKYGIEYNPGILKINPTAETLDHFALTALDIIDIVEDSLPNWPHSKSYLKQINEDFAGCILDDIHKVLDDLGVPRGTFGDEHFYNFVVMYNNRGKYLKALEKQIDSTSKDEELEALKSQVKELSHVLTEIANWPIENENAAHHMRTAASCVVNPDSVKHLRKNLID